MKNVTLISVFFLGAMYLSSQEIINNNTTICWDTSSSMSERNLTKDLSILEKIFQRNGNQEVQLLLFNIDVDENETVIGAN